MYINMPLTDKGLTKGLTQRSGRHSNVGRVTDQTNNIGQHDMDGVV